MGNNNGYKNVRGSLFVERFVIQNAKIYDGTGKSAYTADVLISDGRIAAFGQGICAEKVVDAAGLCLAPGFVDAHTHSDSQLFIDPDRAGKVKMGVTAEIGGQCGWSRAPLPDDAPKDALDYIYTIYGKPDVMPKFDTFAQQLEAMDALPLGAHQKCFVGHHMIHGSVVGMEDRPCTATELDRMCALTEEAMQAGALGLSTGLIYAPGVYARTEEVIALAKVVGKYGGMYTTHIRDEADHVVEAVREAMDIARAAEVPLNISHLKCMFPRNYEKGEIILHMIDEANASGMDVSFDVYPYEASSTTTLSTLPPSYLTCGMDQLVERLTGRENIEKLRDIIENTREDWENSVKNIGVDKMLITIARNTPEAVGKTIREYAQLRGLDDIEAYAEILAKNRGRVQSIHFCMSTENIAAFYRHPRAMLGTDGLYTSRIKLTHPRHFGSFPRYLGHFVRDMGILPMEEAIRRITAVPCERYGIPERGYIKEGYAADMVLFNQNTIIDRADYLDPQRPNVGIDSVYIGGELVMKDNEMTGIYNGKVFRR